MMKNDDQLLMEAYENIYSGKANKYVVMLYSADREGGSTDKHVIKAQTWQSALCQVFPDMEDEDDITNIENYCQQHDINIESGDTLEFTSELLDTLSGNYYDNISTVMFKL